MVAAAIVGAGAISAGASVIGSSMAAGAAMAILGRGSWAEHMGKNLSASGSTIMGYHSLRGFIYEKQRAASIHAGDFGKDGVDPIVEAAKDM